MTTADAEVRVYVELSTMLNPTFTCRYWQVFQRLVLVGWVDDARDLLFSHSELHAPEEQLSRFDKVKAAAAVLVSALHFSSYSHFIGCP